MPRRTSKPSATKRISALLGAAAVVATSLVGVQTFVDIDPAAATYAEGGAGLYTGSIDWIEWGEAPNLAVGNGATASSTRTIAGHDLTTTCTISNLQGTLTTYASGGWTGDSLDDLYNIGGTGGNNTLVNALATANGQTPRFDLSCATTLDGAAVDIAGIVIADAEASGAGQGEYVQATPVGAATWRVIERTRALNCTTNVIGALAADNTLRLRPDGNECSSGPAAIGFMEGATAANVELKGGGKSAVALGVVLEADFGDAPESYGASGALFERTWVGGDLSTGDTNLFNDFTLATPGLPNTRLGANIDADEAHEGSPGADTDEFDDAITPPGMISVTPGDEYTLEDVICTGPGFVAGWIDWNGNGAFDEGERSATAECIGGSVDLTWTVPQDAVEGGSYLRLRIAANEAEIAEPVGLSTSGEVEDYALDIDLPQLEITKTSNATADTRPGDTVDYTVTAQNTGESAYTEAAPAVLFDDLSGTLDDSRYADDATASLPGTVSYAEPLLSWEGALAPGETVTLTYSAVVKGGGDGTARNIAWQPNDPTLDLPPTPVCATDGSDAETGEPCATAEFLLPKLQITKTADPAELPAIGATATFTIELENVGPGEFTDENPANVTDDLSGVLDDATYGSGSATVDGADAAAPVVDGETLTWAGAIGAGQTAMITYDVTYTGAGDNIMINTACVPEDATAASAENCDQASVPGANLTWWKTVEADTSSVAAGTALTYTLHFENTGTINADVDHVDYLAGVLDDADVAAPQNLPGGWTADRQGDALAVAGSVAPGETETLQYIATVKADGERGDDIAANFLLGAGETPPEDPTTNPVCDPTDPERATCTLTPISGFEVHKSGDPESGTAVDAGSTVTYTVTGENTGATTLDPAQIVDDLSSVLDKASFDEATATIDGEPAAAPELDGTQLTWADGLEPGEIVSITYSVTVNADAAGETLENTVSGSAVPPGGDPITTTPETVLNPVNVPGFELSKSVDPASGEAVDPGAVLTYTIVGQNTGQTALGQVDITDDLTNVLAYASLDGDATATIDGEPATAPGVDADTLTWSGSLPAGSSVTITYSVTVDGAAGGETVANTAAGAAIPPGGLEITPPPVTVENPVNEPGFDFSKSVNPESGTAVDPGSVLTYTLTGENTGETALDSVDIADDLSDVLANAAYNDDAIVTVNGTDVDGLTVDGSQLAWAGSLAVGETVTVTYSVTVGPDAGGQILSNTATGTAVPPGGSTITPPPSETTTPVNEPGFEVSKSVDPASGTAVDPGSTLTYTLTGANTGQTGLSDISLADDMSGVLENAEYNDDAVAIVNGEPADGLTVEGGQLAWAGSLAVGETVTVTYSVTVGADAGGETLSNTVSGTATPPGGSTITPPPSETETPVNLPGFSLSKSVDPESGTAVDPGSVLTYTVTGMNTGQTELGSVAIDDDLSGVLAGASYNDDAEATIGGGPVDGLTVEDGQLSWNGALAVGETVEITFSVTVDPDAGGATISNSVTGAAVPPGGSTITPPPSNVVNPVNEPGFEFSKSVDPASGTAVDPGSVLTYTLTGVNTGETVLDPVAIADDLSGVLSHAEFNDDAVATVNGETADAPTVEDAQLAWSNSLAVGETVTITYSVTVDGEAGGETLANVAEGTATPPGGSTITPPPSETETPVNLPGFSLSKSVDPESGAAVDPGSVLTYTLTGENTGETALDAVSVVDDLSGVLSGATYNDDAEATIAGEPVDGLTIDDVQLLWGGALAVGETVEITFSVTVDPDAGGSTIANSLTGSATPPGGSTITPPPSNVVNPVNEPGFDLSKSVDPASGTAVDPGSVLTYTITGENTGETSLDSVEIADDLSAVLAGASYNDDAAATVNGAPVDGLTVGDGQLAWAGPLAIGETVTITYTVTVNGDAGGETLSNVVTGTATPPGGSTITPPPSETTTPVNEPGFEFSKSVDPESGTAVDPGSVLTYTLTGENTGQTALDSVEIADDLSDVLANAAYNDDAVVAINGEEMTDLALDGSNLSWAGALAIGETVTITYSVTVNADAGGQALSNMAEGSATPPGGATITPPPSETTTPVNEPGYEFSKSVDPASGTAVDPGSIVTYTLTGENTGQTALDPVQIADDLSGLLAGALYNDDAVATVNGDPVDDLTVEDSQLAWAGSLAVGETVTVTYSVTVDADAGGMSLSNSASSEAVPPGGSTITPPPSETVTPVNEPGFEFSKSVDPASGSSVDPGSVVTYTLTGVNTGDTALDPVEIADDLSGVLSDASYNDDAVAMIDDQEASAPEIDRDELSWAGSLAAGETVTVTYSVTVDAGAGGETLANSATGTATPPGGSTITPPPSETETPVNLPGFSLSKSVDPESGTAIDPGSVLTYTLTGENTGQTALDAVSVVDDLSGVLDGATYNDDAVATVNGDPVDGLMVDEAQLSWGGALAVGQTVEITFSVTVNPNAGGSTIANSLTGSATPPGGSTITPPPSNVVNPVNEPGFDLSKSVDPASGTAVDPGSVLTYTITGANTGQTALDSVEIADDLTSVLAGAGWNGDAVAMIDGEPVDGLTTDASRLSWSGALGIGQTIAITYSVTVNADAGGTTLENAVTGSATPPGGATITPPPSNVENPVKDPGFEFSKTSDPESGSTVDVGDVVTYTLTGENTGSTVLDPVNISDDLSGVLPHASFNDDAIVQIDGVEVGELGLDGDQLSWSGVLEAGQTVTVTYSVTVHSSAGGATLENSATGTATPPGGSTITPPPAETTNPVKDPGFEFSKTVDRDSGTAVDTGDVVTYTLTGVNTGETVLEPVDVVDDLSGVLSHASFNDDAVARVDGVEVAGLTVDGADLSWSGVLEAGETVTVTYSVTVNADAGGEKLENRANGSATTPGGSKITPPPAQTVNPVSLPGFSLSKSADPESGSAVDPGETVTYTVTGVNTGDTVLDPIDLVDDLSGVLQAASFNDDAVASVDGESAGAIDLNGDELSWSGVLEPGQTVTLQYSVTVNEDAAGETLNNSVSGSATPPGGTAIAPPPAETANPVAADSETGASGFEFSKTSDPRSGTAVDAGDVVTYTLTGVNTGQTVLEPVDIVDDLSGVLHAASYNDDAAAHIEGVEVGGLAVDGERLSWSGALQPGQTVTVVYTVTVDGDAGGEMLMNLANATVVGPSGEMIEPPEQTTQNPVREGAALSPSGNDQAPLIGGIAGLMLLVGASVVWLVSKRRRRA
ncbi:CshA/CshB family fibrillar adhesin-related protein [Microbacterium gubbeenense]|uniref:CshA/CshB family fibrillar adhesin-related protein n=1 Tax=Microbacterium gubbeenense TaxID=159896 RepID=UPI003F999878